MRQFIISSIVVFFLSSIGSTLVFGQEDHPWNNRQCAVVLTYDDGLNVHLDNVIPALDSLGFRATFYIPANAPCLDKRLDEWRLAAKRGHELGNHTLFHPCDGSKPGREWVNRDYDLSKYTLTRALDEIRLENTLLHAIDNKRLRTFAYTCGETTIGGVSFTDSIRKNFTGARGTKTKVMKIDSVDLFNIGTITINGNSGEFMIDYIKKAMKEHALVVFLFHGVGGEHGMNVALDEHRKLLAYLKQYQEEIWIAPLTDVAQFINSYRQGKH